MDYRFADTVETLRLQEMTDALWELTRISVSIVSPRGKILVRTGWQDVCTRFHGTNLTSRKRCRSNRVSSGKYLRPGEYCVRECPNGFASVTIPVAVEGARVASLIMGQFLLAPPDEPALLAQAQELGFEPDAYLDAVRRVPVVSDEQLARVITYYQRFASILGDAAARHRKQMEVGEALRQNEERFRLIADNIADIIWTTDLNLKFTYLSSSMKHASDYSPEDWLGRSLQEFVPVESWELARAALTEELARLETDSGTGFISRTLEMEVRRRTGGTRWVEVTVTFLRDSNGRPTGLLGITRDISERRRAEARVRIQVSAMNAASDQIVIADASGRVEFANRAFETETGRPLDDILGADLRDFHSTSQDPTLYHDIERTVAAGKAWHGEIVDRRSDGSARIDDVTVTPVEDESGAIRHFIAIKRNITEKRICEQRLDHLAHHDSITNLPNRLLFGDRLTRSLARARHDGGSVAVLFLDLDRFKLINDTLGHNVGDILIKSIAERLTAHLRGVDTIARTGGDEFAVILASVADPQDAVRVAGRIQEAFSDPFVVRGHELFVTASVGISVFPSDGADAETLVRNADAAVYRAKEQGCSRYQFYTESLNTAAFERMTLENSLRRALERNEFLVHYQPRVDIRTGRVLGTEALVRWQHPRFGLIAPGHFIPIAEETGLIVPLSELVLRTACHQNKVWHDSGLPPVEVAVNISARQFQQDDLLSTIRRTLDVTGLHPSLLGLELTESALMQDPETSTAILHELKKMGVRISIDDFGTGYSSLSYLKRLPIDAVKIDQSFVRDITTNSDDAAIAGAVVAMAHSLKLRVIAEGVETLEQLEFLRSLNCDEIQGYFISRPMPAKEITQMLWDAASGPSDQVRPAA